MELPSVREVARRRSVPPASVVIAWLLSRSPIVIPIPKTENVKHLEELVLGTKLKLSEDELKLIG